MYEVPGGKIDEGEEVATPKQQMDALVREVLEETNINITKNPIHKTHEYSYIFPHNGKLLKSYVHAYLTLVATEQKLGISINNVFKPDGSPEDNHMSFIWANSKDLNNLRRSGQLLGNSKFYAPVLFRLRQLRAQ